MNTGIKKNVNLTDKAINNIGFVKESEIFKGIAHPVRLNILLLLMQKEYSVTDVADKLGLAQCKTSHHLTILKDKGIINPERLGSKTYYKISEKGIKQIMLILLEKYNN